MSEDSRADEDRQNSEFDLALVQRNDNHDKQVTVRFKLCIMGACFCIAMLCWTIVKLSESTPWWVPIVAALVTSVLPTSGLWARILIKVRFVRNHVTRWTLSESEENDDN